jgi:hypothetical protein
VVRYSTGYRVCLLVGLANVTSAGSAKLLLEDVTAGYPPKDANEL